MLMPIAHRAVKPMHTVISVLDSDASFAEDLRCCTKCTRETTTGLQLLRIACNTIKVFHHGSRLLQLNAV